ncbi:hypothetical protein AB6E26_20975 [Vibrio splendidus]
MGKQLKSCISGFWQISQTLRLLDWSNPERYYVMYTLVCSAQLNQETFAFIFTLDLGN